MSRRPIDRRRRPSTPTTTRGPATSGPTGAAPPIGRRGDGPGRPGPSHPRPAAPPAAQVREPARRQRDHRRPTPDLLEGTDTDAGVQVAADEVWTGLDHARMSPRAPRSARATLRTHRPAPRRGPPAEAELLVPPDLSVGRPLELRVHEEHVRVLVEYVGEPVCVEGKPAEHAM